MWYIKNYLYYYFYYYIQPKTVPISIQMNHPFYLNYYYKISVNKKDLY
jgi:hypothetical protein